MAYFPKVADFSTHKKPYISKNLNKASDVKIREKF